MNSASHEECPLVPRRSAFRVVGSACLGLLAACASSSATRDDAPAATSPTAPLRHTARPADFEPTLAFRWLDILLEASARDVERIGARPTILARQMAIPLTAMFDAWAAYDDTAVGTILGAEFRRPPAERTRANAEIALSYAMYRACVDQLPDQAAYLTGEFRRLGFDPSVTTLDPATPAGAGNYVAHVLIEQRHHDGANQLGDEPGSSGEPYSDYTMYRPVNTPDRMVDPDRWQPVPFDDGRGGKIVLGFLTPHWYRVRPFGLDRADQFRPGPPPLIGSAQLAKEVDECIEFNATLDPEDKAIVEFMRDGPRSTGQSGHWLRFAQDVSVRDRLDLAGDVQLFFAVANAAHDAFIASWEAKRYYDSARPWSLVRHYYRGKKVLGWCGPGKGCAEIDASEWHPYSPSTFITPPFPGYTSGHSTVSAACAEMLRLMTGSDRFAIVEERDAGVLTEPGVECVDMQQMNGRPQTGPNGEPLDCSVALAIPTFSAAAEMAGISRVMGGYHIQADNVAGLELGKKVARHIFPRVRAHIDGSVR